MRNLFKLAIPNGQTKEITELESWTLRWEIQDRGYGSRIQHKCFIRIEEAKSFEKALNDATNLLGTWVHVVITKN